MFTIITMFLKNLSPIAYLSGILGIMLIVMFSMYEIKKLEVKSDDAKVVQLSTTIQTQNMTIASLKQQRDNAVASIAVQNNAVDALKKKSVSLQAKAAEAQKSVVIKETQIQGLINAINSKPVPKDCQGAMKELGTFMKSYATDWNKQ